MKFVSATARPVKSRTSRNTDNPIDKLIGALFILSLAMVFLAATAVAQADAETPAHEAARHGAGPRLGPDTQFIIGDSLGVSPFLHWRTLETENFRITFPAALDEIAQRAGVLFEAAHRTLTPFLKWTPALKTQVLLLNNTDSANGMAAAVNRFGVVLYTVPPENWYSIGYYDDWLKMLIFHEYTHFVNMDTTRGLYAPARVLFGDTILPNAIWPSWMLEGLAVYVETRFTRAGRGRSPYWEMMLRAAVDEGRLDTDSYVTLDRVNGTNPFSPGGDTAYMFGYDLMNQVARENSPHVSSSASAGDQVLGKMSYESGDRVPFFINGNLKNITGKDWYGYWDSFVADTRARMKTDLEKIRSAPLTGIEKLVQVEHGALGSAVSPDGKQIAYTLSSLERRSGLYVQSTSVKPLGKRVRLDDKAQGVGLAYSPDGKFLFYSRATQLRTYNSFSDLYAWDFERARAIRLTEGGRTRDPDVSPDGKWLTFTLGSPGRVVLARAEIKSRKDDSPTLGRIEILFSAPGFSRVSNPKFSPDGKQIAFSLHRNTSPHEEIQVLDVATRSVRSPLAADPKAAWNQDGIFLRFPTYHPNGDLYFVGNLSGVDNIFRVDARGAAEQVSNVTTAAWFPVFSRETAGAQLYANIYSSHGWDLAHLEINGPPVDTTQVTVGPPPAPESAAETTLDADLGKAGTTRDYSSFPSLWPRQWAPFGFYSPTASYLGAQVMGYDAIDVHRYLLAGIWNFGVSKPEAFALYENRQLGATLSFSASERTTNLYAPGNQILAYSREREFNVSASFPFQFTYSSITPFIRFGIDEIRDFDGSVPGGAVTGANPYVPEAEAGLRWSNTESSRLAISPERGRSAMLAGRTYLLPGNNSYKALFQYSEYLPIAQHAVLVPRVKAAYSTYVGSYRDARVLLPGRGQDSLGLGTTTGTSLDKMGIRGYHGITFSGRAAAVPSLDFRFPLVDAFRGWGTNPFFLDQIWGETFVECALLTDNPIGVKSLPSTGIGLRASAEVLVRVPIVLGLDYQYGLRNVKNLPKGDFYVSLSLGALSF